MNYLLGNFIRGTGPENYVFPVNGQVSNFLRNSDGVNSAISMWKDRKSPDSWSGKVSFGLNRQAELGFQNRLISMENFVGSADVTIQRINNTQIMLRVYNITSITSGDLSKHMVGRQWLPSVVRDGSSSIPYSNILQIYQLTFDVEAK